MGSGGPERGGRCGGEREVEGRGEKFFIHVSPWRLSYGLGPLEEGIEQEKPSPPTTLSAKHLEA